MGWSEPIRGMRRMPVAGRVGAAEPLGPFTETGHAPGRPRERATPIQHAPATFSPNVPLGESWYASTLGSETVRLVGLGASEKFNDDEDAHPRFITYLDRYMTPLGEM